MAALRTSSLVFLPLLSLFALATACGGSATPTPPETPAGADNASTTADKPQDTEPVADKHEGKPEEPAPVATKHDDPPADAEPRPKPSISCEPKAGQAPIKGPKLAVNIDRSKVDLDGHKLEVKLNRPTCKVELKVVGESGKTLAEEAQAFNGATAGTTLSVSWSPARTERVLRIEVWGYDVDNNFVGVALTPWNVNLEHEEINFENDSDVIRASEAPKLEKSLDEIKKILDKVKDSKVALFIKGHTDTMGPPEHNLDLSRRRARSIGAWFRGHGLKISISYEGFGEFTPLVKTGDEVSEPKNRRIDYILQFDPPPLPTGSVSFSWKPL